MSSCPLSAPLSKALDSSAKPNSSHGGALRQGLAYTPELTRQIIREAEDSQIVKDQRANP